MKPLALYLHVPFCVQKCLYCDFLSMPAEVNVQQQYVSALLRELEYWRGQITGRYVVSSIYLGGGTPTVLSPDWLQQVGDALQRFPFASQVEFSMEVNPGTLTLDHVLTMQRIGVNRVSLGLQSAQRQELQDLGRIHTYEEFIESYALLTEYGFSNLNIDLMAGIPGQTIETYADTLDQVLAFQPKHLSAYSLIIEEGTPFFEMDQRGELQIPSEETDRYMYTLTKERLSAEGYERYEISNYARPGYACRHNLAYWQMEDYLGVGLGAASYLDGKRFTNGRSLQVYLSQKKDCHVAESHDLSRQEEMEEFVFLGLRKMSGISLEEYHSRFGVDFYQLYRKVLPNLFENGLLADTENHGRIYLTDRGIDVSNTVLAQFLLEGKEAE